MLSARALVTLLSQTPVDLPEDVILLVHQHLAAMRIQRHAFYYNSFDWFIARIESDLRSAF